ncbi:MAG: hypothetical protein CMD08_04350 [Flavobacteriales bacterium]|mgnify:FL=1|nr:hypothetical protein [Flavobacteriales bacterium]
MRQDNPIYNHKFKILPDIAEYSEIKDEYKNNTKVDLTKLYDHLNKYNLHKFNLELDKIIQNTYSYIPLNKAESKEAIKWRTYLNKYFLYYKKFNAKSKIIKNNKIFKNLYNNGYDILNIDTNQIINKDIDKKYKFLTEKKDWVPPPGKFDRWKNLNKNSIENINKLFDKAGILEACSNYYARRMKVTIARLTVGKPTDNHWKQFLYDCKKTTKYTNLHMDAAEGVMKGMMYLNEVKLGNGETSFLPKSNRFIYDPLQAIFCRAIAVGSYCHNPISRRSVFRLPKKLRVTSNFGRLIDNKSNLRKYLDKNLVKLTSNVGNLLLFDPGAGIHNGGVLKYGERIALQIVIE